MCATQQSAGGFFLSIRCIDVPCGAAQPHYKTQKILLLLLTGAHLQLHQCEYKSRGVGRLSQQTKNELNTGECNYFSIIAYKSKQCEFIKSY